MSDEGNRTGSDGVDDVLAAIRRLVTEEEHDRRREASAAAGSLILTADMRVEEPEPDEISRSPEPDSDLNGSEKVPKLAEHRAEGDFDDQIRAIVREELEGALGDRITSGLRKMVRREVTRALNARMQD